MMAVGNVNGVMLQGAGSRGSGMQSDSVSRNIQNQIVEEQKKLQELSSNKDMSPEEKMKKRQEIQQEIASLNQQLRQHQMELRKEQQSKAASREDMPGGSKKTKTAKAGDGGSAGMQTMSQTTMTAVISADASLKQAEIQGNVASRMEGRAGVLKAEIKQDGGKNTEAKEAELASVEQKAENATTAQMNTLSDANRVMKEATEAETEDKKATNRKTAAKEAAGKGAEGIKSADKETSKTSATENARTEYDSASHKTDAGNENRPDETDRRNIYTPVDVRL